jgi:hypothetical protein
MARWSFVNINKVINLRNDDCNKLTVRSLTCKQCFNSKCCNDIELWPLTLKNKTLYSLIMVIMCTKLYDYEAYSSASIMPTMFFYKVLLHIRPWHLTLKSKILLSLIIMIDRTKLYNPVACNSVVYPAYKVQTDRRTTLYHIIHTCSPVFDVRKTIRGFFLLPVSWWSSTKLYDLEA